jgi:hypothetical protein
MEATPRVARNTSGRRSRIDARTRRPGYAVSQVKRKRIEEIFGRLKTVALLRKLRHRAGVHRRSWPHGPPTVDCAAARLIRPASGVSRKPASTVRSVALLNAETYFRCVG